MVLRRSLLLGSVSTLCMPSILRAQTTLDILGGGAPYWVLKGTVPATLDFDFANGRYYQVGKSPGQSPGNLITTSRASTGYADDTNGNYTLFANNVARITNQGLLVEEARTNVVLWNRDLTNAAWTKSNITAALDQVGIDGTSNSATSLLATAGNGTALQAITLSSSARFQSAFVKRITGTGTINMTMDNGTTWTAIVPTSSWTQLSVPTQTLANPTVGFRIVTNGDKIAVDFVQNENGTFATSPILDTTGAVARAADVVTVTTPPVFVGPASYFIDFLQPAGLKAATVYNYLNTDDGTGNNRDTILINQSVGNPVSGITFSASSNLGRLDAAGSYSASLRTKAFYAAANGDRSIISAGTQGATSATAGRPAGLNRINIGSFFDGTLQPNTYLLRLGIWPTTRQPNAVGVRLTQ